MRDRLKKEDYFTDVIKSKVNLITSGQQALSLGKVAENKVDRTKYRILGYKIESLIAQYSFGLALNELKATLEELISSISSSWTQVSVKTKNSKGELFDQYMLSPYERFLQVISLAYLLDVPDTYFQKLVDIVDRDNISDNLLEFIINARFSGRSQKHPEEYDLQKSKIIKVYDKLRKAVLATDKTDASKLIQQFLDKSFYHKNMNLYDSHKNNFGLYCGYWSFESAALIKIMGLDDSSFIDHQYYPKDLVHQSPDDSPPKKGFFGKLGF